MAILYKIGIDFVKKYYFTCFFWCFGLAFWVLFLGVFVFLLVLNTKNFLKVFFIMLNKTKTTSRQATKQQ